MPRCCVPACSRAPSTSCRCGFAGLVVIALAIARHVSGDPALVPFLLPVTVVIAAGAFGLAAIPISEITRARVKRTLNLVEFLVIVTMLVVMAGALGLYGQLGGLFS